MAEEEVAGAAGKGLLGSLKTKVGPLPIGVWVVVGLGVFLYVQHQRSSAAAGAGSGQQIDSAGNVGIIDPATGYVSGSPQDTAALGQSAGGGGSTDTSGAGSGATTAGQYATNDDWARAAVNYLVGLGVDPTVAGQAIQQYLASQTLTTTQQGDLNLAIQSLGAPPTLPPPAASNPTPITTAPGGGTNATNPVTGVRVLPVNTNSSTLSVGWNKSANATGYTASIGTNTAGNNHQTLTAPASGTQLTFGSLQPKTRYYMRVQATPAAPNAPWSAVVSGTTSK